MDSSCISTHNVSIISHVLVDIAPQRLSDWWSLLLSARCHLRSWFFLTLRWRCVVPEQHRARGIWRWAIPSPSFPLTRYWTIVVPYYGTVQLRTRVLGSRLELDYRIPSRGGLACLPTCQINDNNSTRDIWSKQSTPNHLVPVVLPYLLCTTSVRFHT